MPLALAVMKWWGDVGQKESLRGVQRSRIVASSLPVSPSHTFTALSEEAESIVFPSGAYTADHTLLVCPVKARISLPVSRSHIFTVLSEEAESTGSAGFQPADFVVHEF